MSDTATELTPPEQAVEEQPIVEAQGDGDPAPLNVEDDAAVDAALAESAINVPGDEGLVPTSQAGKIAGAYRGKIKELKAELESVKTTAAEAATLKQQIAQLQQQVQQLAPTAQAYNAMVHAAQQVQQPEDTSEAEEYARLLDLYTAEGKPDIERGKRGLALQRKLAEQAAEQRIAPIQQHTVSGASQSNKQRILSTKINGEDAVDSAILDAVWGQLDPALTATPEGAREAFVVAYGRTQLMRALQQQQQPAPQKQPAPRAANGQFAGQQSQEIGDPIFTEKAGGKVGQQVALSKAEQDYCKAAGITEKDFLETANKAPWLRRG